MNNFEMWTNPFDDNLQQFENILKSKLIDFETEYQDGDESTCFYGGVVYTFSNDQDYEEACEIYDNI